MSAQPITAKQLGLTLCHDCRKLIAGIAGEQTRAHYCPRCGARLHQRIPNSLTRTWAFLLTAMCLYIPANLLPILIIERFGQAKPDTILSGVFTLVDHGLWGVAIVVFVASVVVPLLKMLVMVVLLLSVHLSWQICAQHRTGLFRVIAFVGRWSMLDIFVIGLMVALVEFKQIASISAGPGATFFGLVVVFTMLAVVNFDPRLMWDACKTPEESGV